RDGQQPRPPEQGRQLGQLRFAADEGGQRFLASCRSRCYRRRVRQVGMSHLPDPLGSRETFEAPLPEVEQGGTGRELVLAEVGRRLGAEDLASAGQVEQAGGAVGARSEAMAARSPSQSRVLASMSVNRNVSVPQE